MPNKVEIINAKGKQISLDASDFSKNYQSYVKYSPGAKVVMYDNQGKTTQVALGEALGKYRAGYSYSAPDSTSAVTGNKQAEGTQNSTAQKALQAVQGRFGTQKAEQPKTLAVPDGFGQMSADVALNPFGGGGQKADTTSPNADGTIKMPKGVDKQPDKVVGKTEGMPALVDNPNSAKTKYKAVQADIAGREATEEAVNPVVDVLTKQTEANAGTVFADDIKNALGNFDAHGGTTFIALRKYNESISPEELKAKIQNENFIQDSLAPAVYNSIFEYNDNGQIVGYKKNITDKANELGISEQQFVQENVLPNMVSQAMARVDAREDQKNEIKGIGDYLLAKLGNSFIGQTMALSTKTRAQRQSRAQALGTYEQQQLTEGGVKNLVARIGGEAVGAMGDAPLFMLGGEAGKGASAVVGKAWNAIGKEYAGTAFGAFAKTIAPLAEKVGGRALTRYEQIVASNMPKIQQLVRGFARTVPNSVANMSTFMGSKGGMNEIYGGDDTSLTSVLKAIGSGMKEGAEFGLVMSATGVPMNVLKMNASLGTTKAFIGATGKAMELGSMVGLDWVKEGDDFNFTDSTLRNLTMLIGMHYGAKPLHTVGSAVDAVLHPWKTAKAKWASMMSNDGHLRYKFTDAEKAELQRALPGMDIYDLGNMDISERYKRDSKGILVRGADGIPEKEYIDKDGKVIGDKDNDPARNMLFNKMSEIFGNPNISWETKQKISGGMFQTVETARPRMTDWKVLDGNRVEFRDKDGNLIAVREFKNNDECLSAIDTERVRNSFMDLNNNLNVLAVCGDRIPVTLKEVKNGLFNDFGIEEKDLVNILLKDFRKLNEKEREIVRSANKRCMEAIEVANEGILSPEFSRQNGERLAQEGNMVEGSQEAVDVKDYLQKRVADTENDLSNRKAEAQDFLDKYSLEVNLDELTLEYVKNLANQVPNPDELNVLLEYVKSRNNRDNAQMTWDSYINEQGKHIQQSVDLEYAEVSHRGKVDGNDTNGKFIIGVNDKDGKRYYLIDSDVDSTTSKVLSESGMSIVQDAETGEMKFVNSDELSYSPEMSVSEDAYKNYRVNQLGTDITAKYNLMPYEAQRAPEEARQQDTTSQNTAPEEQTTEQPQTAVLDTIPHTGGEMVNGKKKEVKYDFNSAEVTPEQRVGALMEMLGNEEAVKRLVNANVKKHEDALKKLNKQIEGETDANKLPDEIAKRDEAQRLYDAWKASADMFKEAEKVVEEAEIKEAPVETEETVAEEPVEETPVVTEDRPTTTQNGIPLDENGNAVLEPWTASADKALEYLQDEIGLTREQTDEFLNGKMEQVKKAETALKARDTKQTNNENALKEPNVPMDVNDLIGWRKKQSEAQAEYEKKKAELEQERNAIESQRAILEERKAYLQSIADANTAKFDAERIAKERLMDDLGLPNHEFTEEEILDNIPDDRIKEVVKNPSKYFEPETPEDAVNKALAGMMQTRGWGITPQSLVRWKISPGDIKKLYLQGLIVKKENGGQSIEQIAHEMHQNWGDMPDIQHQIALEDVPQLIYDAIMSGNPRSYIADKVRREYEKAIADSRADLERKRDEFFEEEYGLTYDEYVDWAYDRFDKITKENNDIPREEIDRIFAEETETTNTEGNDNEGTDRERGGEEKSPEHEGKESENAEGDTVLQEAQPDDTTGTEVGTDDRGQVQDGRGSDTKDGTVPEGTSVNDGGGLEAKAESEEKSSEKVADETVATEEPKSAEETPKAEEAVADEEKVAKGVDIAKAMNDAYNTINELDRNGEAGRLGSRTQAYKDAMQKFSEVRDELANWLGTATDADLNSLKGKIDSRALKSVEKEIKDREEARKKAEHDAWMALPPEERYKDWDDEKLEKEREKVAYDTEESRQYVEDLEKELKQNEDELADAENNIGKYKGDVKKANGVALNALDAVELDKNTAKKVDDRVKKLNDIIGGEPKKVSSNLRSLRDYLNELSEEIADAKDRIPDGEMADDLALIGDFASEIDVWIEEIKNETDKEDKQDLCDQATEYLEGLLDDEANESLIRSIRSAEKLRQLGDEGLDEILKDVDSARERLENAEIAREENPQNITSIKKYLDENRPILESSKKLLDEITGEQKRRSENLKNSAKSEINPIEFNSYKNLKKQKEVTDKFGNVVSLRSMVGNSYEIKGKKHEGLYDYINRISNELDEVSNEINKIESSKEGSKEDGETSYKSLQDRARRLTENLNDAENEKSARLNSAISLREKYSIAPDGLISNENLRKLFHDLNKDGDKNLDILFDLIQDKIESLGFKSYVNYSQSSDANAETSISEKKTIYGMDALCRLRLNKYKVNDLLHEQIHNAIIGLQYFYDEPSLRSEMRPNDIKAAKELHKIYNVVIKAKNNGKIKGEHYGLETVYELIAESKNSDLRKALEGIKYDTRSAWKAFIDTVRDWIADKTGLVSKSDGSQLNDVVEGLDEILGNFLSDYTDKYVKEANYKLHFEGVGTKITKEDKDLTENDKKAIEELNSGKTKTVYRAMQVIDGKLYPPMAAKVGGELVEGAKIGDILKADEHPELIKMVNGRPMFKLDKGGKDATGKKATDVTAAYNPYWHTSNSPLNDQFKSAWIRPNMVVVECEIPESELTSGYKADYAKDAVGKVDWKSGGVTGTLQKMGHPGRDVYLSRYCKISNVLTDAESAQKIKEFIGDYDATIPMNVVTPKLRAELEKIGVKIGKPEKGVNLNEQIEEALQKGLEVDNSVRFREAWARENGIINGELTIDSTVELFNRLNGDEALGKLAEKVFEVARKFNPTIKLTRQLSTGALGNCGVTDGIVKYNFGFFQNPSCDAQEKANVLIHELIHSATNYAIHSYELILRGKTQYWDALTDGQKEAVRDLYNIFCTVKQKPSDFIDKDGSTAYGLTNAYEFAAEMANGEFREQLKKKNLWVKFKDAVKRFFGFEKEGATQSTAYDEAMKALDYILEHPNEDVYEAIKSEYRGRSRKTAMIGGNRKAEMDSQLAKKRPDMSEEQRKQTIAEIEKIGEKVKEGGDPKTEKLAQHWVLKGNLILPEDEYKLLDAMDVAQKKGIDPFTYDNPTKLLMDNSDVKPSVRKTNPDTIKVFSNKKEGKGGLVIYDVENSKEGQKAVRQMIDEHWGEDANPWCLAARHGEGDVELSRAWQMWNRYDAQQKRIAFLDGKLIGFCATDREGVTQWWDRFDESNEEGITIKSKSGKKKFEATIDEDGNFVKYNIIYSGEIGKDGYYIEYDTKDPSKVIEYVYTQDGRIYEDHSFMNENDAYETHSFRNAFGNGTNMVTFQSYDGKRYLSEIQDENALEYSKITSYNNDGYVREVRILPDNLHRSSRPILCYFGDDGYIGEQKEVNAIFGDTTFATVIGENSFAILKRNIYNHWSLKYKKEAGDDIWSYRIDKIKYGVDGLEPDGKWHRISRSEAEKLINSDWGSQELYHLYKLGKIGTDYDSVMKQALDDKAYAEKKYPEGMNIQGNENYRFREEEGKGANIRTSIARSTMAKSVIDSLGGKGNVVSSIEEVKDERVRKAIESGRNIKGWYDTKTGEVHIYLPNCEDSRDVETTVFHEKVGHEGLRKVVGEKNWQNFLHQVFRGMSKADKKAIIDKANKKGWNFDVAIDEHLAEMAEDVRNHAEVDTAWQKIKNVWNTMLRKLGFKNSMTENDIRQAIWLSKNALENKTGSLEYMAKKKAFEYKLSKRVPKEKMSEDKSKFEGKNKNINSPMGTSDRSIYDNGVNSIGFLWTEAHQNALRSLQLAQEAVMGEGNAIKDSENAFMALNRLPSTDQTAMEEFKAKYSDPFTEHLRELMSKFDGETLEERYENLEKYLIAKHGLERNRVFFVRDVTGKLVKSDEPADKALGEQIRTDFLAERKRLKTELDNGTIGIDEYYRQLDEWIRNKVDSNYDASKMDKSGLSDAEGFKEWADGNGVYDESKVLDYIKVCENKMGKTDVDKLWNEINDINNYTIDKQYESGMSTTGQKNRAKEMFDWYIPLRGFDADTAEDLWNYIGREGKPSVIGMRTADHRITRAKNPISTMIVMANGAIMQGNRNLAKMHLFRLVQNNANPLFTEMNLYYEKKTAPNGEEYLEPIYPTLREGMTGEEMNKAMENYNAAIDRMKKSGAEIVKDTKSHGDLEIKFERDSDAEQHMIHVMVGGKRRTLFVNGNPRVAQAVNGMIKDKNAHWIKSVNNFMSQMATSKSATFILRNGTRDFEYATATLAAVEGKGYVSELANNYRKLSPTGKNEHSMLSLFKRYREGTLDMSNDIDKKFSEFVKNGGMTGYVQMGNVEEMQREMESMLKKGKITGLPSGNKLIELGGKIGDGFEKVWFSHIETLNEAVENQTRFAVYLTSRTMKNRTVARSIYDAKNAGVNFNLSGAGFGTNSMKTKNESTWHQYNRMAASYSATFLRNAVIFYNAGIQGMSRTAQVTFGGDKKQMLKAIGSVAAVPMAMGMLAPAWNRLATLGDTDEDRAKFGDNPYAQLPEYERRQNLCLYVGHGRFVKIPLAIELRAFYGLGDLAAGAMGRYGGYKWAKGLDGEGVVNPESKLSVAGNYGYGLVKELAQITPVDIFGGSKAVHDSWWGGVLGITIPSAAAPFFAAGLAGIGGIHGSNVGWTGSPISHRADYNSNQAEWKKAATKTPRALVSVTKWLSDITGGNEVKGGWLDINPSELQYIADQYGAGAFKDLTTTASGLFNSLLIGFDYATKHETDRQFNVGDLPVAKAFFRSRTTSNALSVARTRYYNYIKESGETNKDMANYKSEATKSIEGQASYIKFMNSPAVMRAQVLKQYQNEIKKMQMAKNEATSRSDRDVYQEQINMLMDEAVRKMDLIEDMRKSGQLFQ